MVTLLQRKFFSDLSVTQKAKSVVKEKLPTLSSENSEPSPKCPHTEVWNTFNAMLAEAGASVCESGINELDVYLTEPLVPFHQETLYEWWNNSKNSFLMWLNLLRSICAHLQFLWHQKDVVFFPPSNAGHVYNDKRSTLAPEKAEMLLFNNFMFYKNNNNKLEHYC